MTYVDKFCKILKDLGMLSKEQEECRDQIMEILAKEDVAMVEAAKGSV